MPNLQQLGRDIADRLIARMDGLMDRSDPLRLTERAGIVLDDWQMRVLRSTAPVLVLNCARQIGKSTAVALVVTRTLLLADQLVIIASPSAWQSKELWRKVLNFWRKLGKPVQHVSVGKLGIELVNGSRVEVRSGNEGTTRGATATLLVIDEASLVSDELFEAVSPMLAVSGGRLLAPSTPHGRRGWWYKQCVASGSPTLAYLGPVDPEDLEPDVEYIEVPVTESNRHPARFLARERRKGERFYDQEYLCRFVDNESQAFATADIEATLKPMETWDYLWEESA